MVTCPRCGAHIEPSALACPYCQTQTQYGREHAEREAAQRWQAAQANRAQQSTERQMRQEELRKKGQHALFSSLAGAVTCCFPFAVAGLVIGLNVKSAAKREGLVAPGTSTAAVIFGVCSLALFLGLVALYVRDSREKDARVAALNAQIEGVRARETIDQRLGCALVEIELLEEGFADEPGLNIDGFQCDGKLEQDGERAVLHDVRFRTSSSERHAVAACLVRGGRWSVKELRADGSCAPRAAAPGASAR